jgi:hypothetical protein
MANPISGAKAQASNAVSGAAASAKNAASSAMGEAAGKLDEMKSMADKLKNMSNLSNVFNLGGLMGKLGDAAGVLAMATPDALLPDLAGKLRGAQKILKIAENITKMVSKAKSIGDAKSGIPSTDSAKAGAMDKLNEAKNAATEKAKNAASVAGGSSSLGGGAMPSISNNSNLSIGGISAGKLTGGLNTSGIAGKVSGGSFSVPTVGNGFGGGLNL